MKILKSKELLVVYAFAVSILLLLLAHFFLILRVHGKLDRMEQVRKEESKAIKEKINNLRKTMTALQSVSTSEVNFPMETGMTTSVETKSEQSTKAFPLIADPYFRNLYKGKNDEQKLTIGIAAYEKGFNRILENSAQIVEWHDYYVNDFLAKRHWLEPTKWSPHLAQRLEVTSDNREFKIFLREKVRWHKPLVDWSDPKYQWLKGDHYVTSKDFYFAYIAVMNSRVKANHIQSNYRDIESFSIIDEYTFTIRWKKSLYTNLVYTLEQFPLPHFIMSKDQTGREFISENLALGINSQKLADGINNHWYNDRMLGCGPYMLSQHQEGSFVELTRNEDYYDYKPAVKSIQFVVVKDSELAYQQLKEGKINVLPQLPENMYRKYIIDAKNFKQRDKVITQVYPRAIYYHIKWNNAHPIFRDKMVRRAMTHAFNREWVLKNLFMGLGTIATSGIPSDSEYHNSSIKPYKYSLKKTKEILEQRGWQDEDGDGVLEKYIAGKKVDFRFTLFFYQRGNSNHRKMYLLYQKSLNKIGIAVTAKEISWPEVQKRYETKDFEVIHGGWLTDIPMVDFYQIWHSSYADRPASSNHIHFKNSQVDIICRKMREATGIEERITLAHRMQKILHEEQPYTFLFFTKGVAAFTPDVQNRFIRKVRPYILAHPYYRD